MSTQIPAVTDLSIAMGSSLGPDITMVVGGKQSAHISPFLTALDSSELPYY